MSGEITGIRWRRSMASQMTEMQGSGFGDSGTPPPPIPQFLNGASLAQKKCIADYYFALKTPVALFLFRY